MGNALMKADAQTIADVATGNFEDFGTVKRLAHAIELTGQDNDLKVEAKAAPKAGMKAAPKIAPAAKLDFTMK